MIGLPKWLLRRVNTERFLIDDFLTAVAKEIPPGSVVLDAGAGECQYATLFRHCTYISVDFARGDSCWNYKRLSMIGDLLSLPIRNCSIDVVICTQTLEHINDPSGVLRELWCVLKTGGWLYLTAPQGEPIHQAPHDFYRFTYFGLEHLFLQSGFNVKSIHPQGGCFLFLAYCLQYVHRILFPRGRPFLTRVMLSPLQFLIALFGCIVIPLILYYLDRFDKKKIFTLHYECRCQKD